MTQPFRLREGGLIDRQTAIAFTFNGRPYSGYAGDSLASALLANGVRVVSRSFKYQRPRGIVAAGVEEPNAIVNVGIGGRLTPNLRATEVELVDGLTANSVRPPPTARHRIFDAIGSLFPAGFYYKTFMSPRRGWPIYEEHIRRAAGLGVCPPDRDPDVYDQVYDFCDVLVVGAGPSGLVAALEAGRIGARVMVVDEQAQPGGALLRLRDDPEDFDHRSFLRDLVGQLDGLPNIEYLQRSTAFGYYDHNLVAVLERRSPKVQNGMRRSRERLHHVRAKQVILATGAIERPLVFPNNDVPGVLMASAVSTYINRYAVAPGSRAMVLTCHDQAYEAAFDLHIVGKVPVTIVDTRAQPSGDCIVMANQLGIEVVAGHVITDVRGRSSVNGVELSPINDAGTRVTGLPRAENCDLVAVSGGWSPALHLSSHTGAKPRWCDRAVAFVPGEMPNALCVGACRGDYTLGSMLNRAAAAGLIAAARAGARVRRTPTTYEVPIREVARPQALFMVPGRQPIARRGKQFVDLQLDVTAADIALAVREGYDSAEHIKRYTALGFGTDQGKLGNVNGIAIAAQLLGTSASDIGTTTFRPAYTPVTFGALAGRHIGQLYEPLRKTPLDTWHDRKGAVWENVGQWRRPWYYPRTGEDMASAVARECLAVRNRVGMFDASTLGKISIEGRHAAEFLERVYTNRWKKLVPGKCRYGIMLREDGTILDDGVTACIDKNRYLLHTTTGGAATVYAWLEQWLQTEWPDLEVFLTSVTDHWATVTLSGPYSRSVLAKLCNGIDLDGHAFKFLDWRSAAVAGVPARIFRISFTGELCYEINVPANYAQHVWEQAYAAGAEFDISPYGTEAMHVLRAEKGFIVVGQDTDGTVTPIDVGMSWAVARKKAFSFIGARSLDRPDSTRANRRQLVGLLTTDPNTVLPEGGQLVREPTAQVSTPMIGYVTSSYFSAFLNRSIALALVESGRSRLSELVYCPTEGASPIAAHIVEPVFVDPHNERQNV